MMSIEQIKFSPEIIFKGVDNDYYHYPHKVNINEEELLSFSFTDYYFNSLVNPKPDDLEVINLWKSKSRIKLSQEIIPSYKGGFNVPLHYCICNSETKQYLVVLGGEETQPTIYRLCVEEIWTIDPKIG